MGAVVRTSSLNDKHSYQLFRMDLRDKITPTLITPYPQAYFPLPSVAEALFVLSFPFLIECFFFVHAKAAVTDHNHPKMTLSMRVGHVIPPTHLDTTDILTHTHIYISREISIEHPSVGLASLSQL